MILLQSVQWSNKLMVDDKRTSCIQRVPWVLYVKFPIGKHCLVKTLTFASIDI